MASFNIELSADSRFATISSLSPTGVQFAAGDLDRFIADLASLRRQMVPDVPEDFPIGKPTHRHDATKYHFGFDPFAGTFVLSFRSPAFGWLSFGISKDNMERIYRSAQELQKNPPAGYSGTKQ